MPFVLPTTDLAGAALRAEPLERLSKLIEQHIAEERYPGAQVAIARHGKLVFGREFGLARIGSSPPPRSGSWSRTGC